MIAIYPVVPLEIFKEYSVNLKNNRVKSIFAHTRTDTKEMGMCTDNINLKRLFSTLNSKYGHYTQYVDLENTLSGHIQYRWSYTLDHKKYDIWFKEKLSQAKCRHFVIEYSLNYNYTEKYL